MRFKIPVVNLFLGIGRSGWRQVARLDLEIFLLLRIWVYAVINEPNQTQIDGGDVRIGMIETENAMQNRESSDKLILIVSLMVCWNSNGKNKDRHRLGFFNMYGAPSDNSRAERTIGKARDLHSHNRSIRILSHGHEINGHA